MIRPSYSLVIPQLGFRSDSWIWEHIIRSYLKIIIKIVRSTHSRNSFEQNGMILPWDLMLLSMLMMGKMNGMYT